MRHVQPRRGALALILECLLSAQVSQLVWVGVTMVQLSLNLTRHACGMYSTRHVFHFVRVQACMHSQGR